MLYYALAALASVALSNASPIALRDTAAQCCNQLNALVGAPLLPILPSELNTPLSLAYPSEITGHWSTSAYGHPACIYKPASSTPVSKIAEVVASLVNNDCKFAIRSGGHMPIPGYASPEDGVLISLSGRTERTLLDGTGPYAGTKLVRIGAGNRWQDVYNYLDTWGLVAVGGRVGMVGVGGFLLGGGISHLNPVYGLAADNVVSYEIILPSGQVVTASATSYTDLYWALKGGSGNFGLVTSFTLRTYYHPQIWGGVIYYPIARSKEVLQAITRLQLEYPNDHAALIPVFLTQSNQQFIQVTAFHPDVSGNAPPETLQMFLDIPYISSTVIKRNLASLAQETIGGPNGFRYFFTTGTIRAHEISAPLVFSTLREKIMASQFGSLINVDIDIDLNLDLGLLPSFNIPIDLNVGLPSILAPDLGLYLSLQPMPKIALNKGSHSFGLEPNDGPYICYIVIGQVIANALLDEPVSQLMIDFHETVQQRAAQISTANNITPSLAHPFTYINDAGYELVNGQMQMQTGFSSYTPSKLAQLKSIRDIYDPNGKWNDLVGGWKIPA